MRTEAPENTQPLELKYLSEDSIAYRGKILAVVTSTGEMGEGETTGYELTELSRAYYVFTANGFEVDIASPKGGNPPVVIDDGDMDVYDYAFLNDPVAQAKVQNSLPTRNVVSEAYQGVYFVGGKGAMYDFPNDLSIQSLVRDYYESGKIVGAVCHGPAALVNVDLSNGQPLLEGKAVSSFTNQEELFLIPDAEEIFPFLLQSQLTDKGAKFRQGTMYLENVVQDGNLITGQNPWSTWLLAETMIEQLGHTPKPRETTSEEISGQILTVYHAEGTDAAKELIDDFISAGEPINRELIGVHSIVSAMQLKPGKSADLIGLLRHIKNSE